MMKLKNSKKLKIKIAELLAISLMLDMGAASFAQAQLNHLAVKTPNASINLVSKAYKLQSVSFEFDSVKDPHTGSEVKVESIHGDSGAPFFGDNGFVGASIERDRIISGNIVVEEYNDESMTLRKMIVPAQLMIKAKGITLGLKSTWNSSLEIHGMEGKSIQELFSSSFSGEKVSLGAGFIIGLNPNYTELNSKNGISIVDLESLLAATGVGLQVLSMKAKFRITNQPTEIIYVTTQSGESVVSHHTKLGSVINYKLN